jgi:hypothetical protein
MKSLDDWSMNMKEPIKGTTIRGTGVLGANQFIFRSFRRNLNTRVRSQVMKRTQVLLDCDFHEAEGCLSAPTPWEPCGLGGFSEIFSLDCTAGDSWSPGKLCLARRRLSSDFICCFSSRRALAASFSSNACRAAWTVAARETGSVLVRVRERNT